MKNIKEKIIEIVGNRQNVSVNEIIEMLLPEYDCDVESLKHRVLKQEINQAFAQIKDSDGVREYLSYENAEKDCVMQKINGCPNFKGLRTSIDKMKSKVAGMQKTIAKGERQLYLKENQFKMIFNDEKNIIEKNIKAGNQ